MAGLGAAMNTGNVGRGDTVAVIGCGGVGSAAVAGARLAGAARIIAVDIDDRKLDWAKGLGATDAVQVKGKSEDEVVEAIQGLTGGFGADVVIDAVGRPETWRQAFYGRDLAGTVVLVGVPDAGHAAGHAAARLLRPRRLAEVQLVRRLPAQPRLPDARRPAPAGPAAPGEASSRRPSGSATSRRRSRRCTTATSCARSSCCEPAAQCRPPGRPRPHHGHVQPGRRHLGGDQQRLGHRRRRRVHRRRRAPRRRRDRASWSATGRVLAIACTHAHDDHVRVAPELADRLQRADPAAPGRPRAVGPHPPRPGARRRPGRRHDARRSAATTSRSCTPPATRPARSASGWPTSDVVFTGDTLFAGGPGATGRSFSDFPTIIESIRTRLLVLPADTARAHRPRRRHDDRRRGPAPAGVDRPRALARRDPADPLPMSPTSPAFAEAVQRLGPLEGDALLARLEANLPRRRTGAAGGLRRRRPRRDLDELVGRSARRRRAGRRRRRPRLCDDSTGGARSTRPGSRVRA